MTEQNNSPNSQSLPEGMPLQDQIPESEVNTYQETKPDEQLSLQQNPENLEKLYEQPEQPDGTSATPSKKKSRRTIAVFLVVLFILSAATATVYAFQDPIKNSLAKMILSPAKYYAYVEKNALSDTVHQLTPYLGLGNPSEQEAYSYNVTSDVSFNHDTIDSLLQSALGTSLTNLEASIGIPLESIGFDAWVGSDGNRVNETVGIRLNKTKLITAELFMDYSAQQMLLRLPELSDAYLNLKNTTDDSIDMSKMKLITADRNADLLKRYGNIIVDNLKQVTKEDDITLSTDNLTQTCTALTVTLTNEDARQMLTAILDEAESDEYILELLPIYNITAEQYQKYIDEARKALIPAKSSQSDESMKMKVYVDGNGNIIGREISSEGTGAFGYTLLSNPTADEYHVFLKNDTGADLLNITGKQTREKGVYNGTAKVTVNSSDEQASDFSLDVSYKDIRFEKNQGHYYQYGNATISSLDLMGLQINMDYGVTDGQQTCKTVFQMGAEPLVTINSKAGYSDNYEVKAPSKDAKIFDYSEADSYQSTFKLDEYISSLSKQLGVDLQSLINFYLSATAQQ